MFLATTLGSGHPEIRGVGIYSITLPSNVDAARDYGAAQVDTDVRRSEKTPSGIRLDYVGDGESPLKGTNPA